VNLGNWPERAIPGPRFTIRPNVTGVHSRPGREPGTAQPAGQTSVHRRRWAA